MSSAAASKMGTGISGFLMRRWNDMPEIVGSSALALLGITTGGFCIYYNEKYDMGNKRYKAHYTVYRHDDPRVATIRKDYKGDK